MRSACAGRAAWMTSLALHAALYATVHERLEPGRLSASQPAVLTLRAPLVLKLQPAPPRAAGFSAESAAGRRWRQPAPPRPRRAIPAADSARAAPAPPALSAAAPQEAPEELIAAAFEQQTLPPYPPQLRAQGISGTVWLRVWVTAQGLAGQVEVVQSSGYRLMDQAACAAVRHWRFRPMRRKTQALDSWVAFPLRFKLEDD